jgi:threonylcarbamoyladenosine tRNA methylthiotransferase MtaB
MTLSQNDLGEVHSCEIQKLILRSEVRLEIEHVLLKVQDGCDYKCTYCNDSTSKGISRSDEL